MAYGISQNYCVRVLHVVRLNGVGVVEPEINNLLEYDADAIWQTDHYELRTLSSGRRADYRRLFSGSVGSWSGRSVRGAWLARRFDSLVESKDREKFIGP